MTNHMTRTDLASFREVLRTKQAELSGKSRGLESIAIERSADEIEEAQYKSARELAIAGLNRESAIRRNIELALIRIDGQALAPACTAGPKSPGGAWRQCHGRHSASAARKRPIAEPRVLSRAPSPRFSRQ